MIKIGIIKEGKKPADARVPLTPQQCKKVINDYPIEIIVQSSEHRCFPDSAYREAGIPIVTDEIKEADILLGVKEVPIDALINNKSYFFFSHTIKKQPYNRDLLRAILDKNIRLIDYEKLVDHNDHRLIAFGRHAGKVGAHNALYTYGKRHGSFTLPRMYEFDDYASARAYYATIKFPAIKVVLTGHGRVGNGAATVLDDMGFVQVGVDAFLEKDFDKPVYVQLQAFNYFRHKDKPDTFDRHYYYDNPEEYKSIFAPYLSAADIMINGIFWDRKAPAFFTLEEMKSDDFNLEVIADVSCDIAPDSSIPSTLEATTIENPIYGFHRYKAKKVEPHGENTVDMMTIDNLPNELPRDASEHFGNQFILHVLPELENLETSDMIGKATIANDGELGTHFQYLQDYVDGKE